MSKEKNFLENDFVSIRSSKIVFCQDGRILSIDKDTEIVDLRDCENCKQKDARIAELEKQLEEAIVPKFKVGDEVWVIKRIKKEIANGKIIKQYSYFNGGTPENLRNVNRWRIRLKNNSEVTKKEYELFVTREQAEEELEKAEGK